MRRFRSKSNEARALRGDSRLVVGVIDHDSVKAELIRLREAYGKAPEEKG